MTKREKNIISLAVIVGIVFVITQVFPLVRDLYADRASRVEALQRQIEREQRLIEEADIWHQRREEVDQRRDSLQTQLFNDPSIPLISANVQRQVRDYAMMSEIVVTSTKLAETMQTPGWLLVKQELSILTGNQNNLMRFLQQLENATPKLAVSSFSIRRNRNQYTGTLTVVGFSRTEAAKADSAD